MRRALAVSLACLMGCSSRGESSSTVQRAEPLTAAGSLSVNRYQFAWTLLKDGSPMLCQGYANMGDAQAITEVFDMKTNTWSRTKDALDGFGGHTATYLPALDKVLIVGQTAEIFDLSINKWLSEPVVNARVHHTATLLPSGKLLVVGGDAPGPTYGVLGAELYDPAAASGSRWSAAGTMIKKRSAHATTVLLSGKILVSGGSDGTNPIDDSEIYDPATNTWTVAGAMNEAREGAGVVRLSDGRVLSAGGWNGVSKTSAEIFDPSTGKWAYLPDLDTARSGPSASLLPTGRVLLAGGDSAAGPTTLVFDPKTNKWLPGPALAAQRFDHAAIPISGNRILLVAGKTTGYAPVSTSEIFGGLVGGATCVIDEECVSGTCSSGKCTGSTDAGVDTSADTSADTSVVDTGTTPIDTGTIDTGTTTTPPDAAVKPVASGDFTKCDSAQQCKSGFCVDGVCCDTACDSPCHSCTLPGSPGICSPEPYGTDRKNKCGAAGACIGTCDGKGGCTAAASGTQCGIAKCTSESTGVGPAVCAGAGASCNDGARIEFDCSPYACEPTVAACRSTCTDSSECAPGYLCDANARLCSPAPPGDEGGGCAYGRSSSFGLGWLVVAMLLARRRLT